MDDPVDNWHGQIASWLREQWTRYGTVLLLIAVVIMIVAALYRCTHAFSYLLFETDGVGAHDLKLRYWEVQRWFAGLAVYDPVVRGDYPPASYALLWPFLGWLSFTYAKWLWASAMIAALGGLAYLTVRESHVDTHLQGCFVAMLVFAGYAVQVTILLGQLGVCVLFSLVAGLVGICRDRDELLGDLVASTLLVLALVKLTMSVPFLWLVCFLPGRLRPVLLVATGYTTVTLFAILFQPYDLSTLLFGWLAEEIVASAGYGNVHSWLAIIGLETWMLPASLMILACTGIWMFYHRHGDYWILIGIAAIVARLWAHHRLYDDLLILMPMIALFRLSTKGDPSGARDVIAGVLLAVAWCFTLIPVSFFSWTPPFVTLVTGGQTVLWMTILLFLMNLAHRERSASAPERTSV